MGTTGDGLMTVQAVGAVTVHQTTVPLIQHGGPGRAVSASQLDAEDTLCNLTPWCRYTSFWTFFIVLLFVFVEFEGFLHLTKTILFGR